MSEKLKPCPFCGSKDEYLSTTSKLMVACEGCGAEMFTPEKWNTRPTEKAAREDVLEMVRSALINPKTCGDLTVFPHLMKRAVELIDQDYQKRFNEQG